MAESFHAIDFEAVWKMCAKKMQEATTSGSATSSKCLT